MKNSGKLHDTYDVRVVGGEQTLLPRIPEVASVADGDLLIRQPWPALPGWGELFAYFACMLWILTVIGFGFHVSVKVEKWSSVIRERCSQASPILT